MRWGLRVGRGLLHAARGGCSRAMADRSSVVTAGIIVIGDEILKVRRAGRLPLSARFPTSGSETGRGCRGRGPCPLGRRCPSALRLLPRQRHSC